MMDPRSSRRSDIPIGPSFSTLIDGWSGGRNKFRKRKSGLRRKFRNNGKSIPGSPGTDFPDLNSIPITRFNCLDAKSEGGTRQPGFYADVETQCQVTFFCVPERIFHVL